MSKCVAIAVICCSCSFDPSTTTGAPSAHDATPTTSDAAGDGASATGDGANPTGDGANPTFQVVETMSIDVASSVPQMSATTLFSGVTYRLRASGAVTAKGDCDADYCNFSAPEDKGSSSDLGLGVDDGVVDLDTQPDWGPYDPSHVYEVAWLGEGAPISVGYIDANYGNNAGIITLEILALQ